MMASDTLQEGCSYSLITEPESNAKREVYLVKLTDSCMMAIQEFVHELKVGSRTRSIIRFDEAQNGIITIPGKSVSAAPDRGKKFHFAISNNPASEINPLPECIMQPKWRSDKLVSFGPLEQKISVAATDDSYGNTRNRMAQVDQERKDVRTKEIKLAAGTKKGQKPKISVTDAHKSQVMKNINIKKINNYSIPKLSNSPKPSVTSSTNHISSAVIAKRSPVPNSLKSSPTSTTNSPLANGKTFTCKDRVIHVLALRSHKKPEVISRLQREAMSQKDRSNLAMVLQQVSSQRDNQYTLLPHLYVDLQVDTWPFYTDTERETAKKNISMYSKQKAAATTPPLVSSTSKSPETKVSKRPSPAVVNGNHINKKTKVEANEEQPSSTSVSPPKMTTFVHSSVNEKKKTLNAQKEAAKSQGEESPPKVASTSDSPEYLTSYKTITTREQRFQYKRDFQLEYPEYIELKNNMDAITTKFMGLDFELKKTEKGSQEYVKIQEEIRTTYHNQQKDEKYHTLKCRCEELHQKLSHIKRLVMEYDNQMVNS